MIQKALPRVKKNITKNDIKHQAILEPELAKKPIERHGIEKRGKIENKKKVTVLDFQSKDKKGNQDN